MLSLLELVPDATPSSVEDSVVPKLVVLPVRQHRFRLQVVVLDSTRPVVAKLMAQAPTPRPGKLVVP